MKTLTQDGLKSSKRYAAKCNFRERSGFAFKSRDHAVTLGRALTAAGHIASLTEVYEDRFPYIVRTSASRIASTRIVWRCMVARLSGTASTLGVAQ